jgi:PAS domain S-box-containing protein
MTDPSTNGAFCRLVGFPVSMTLPIDTWPAVAWIWLIEGAAFFVLLQWSWNRAVPGAQAFRALVFGSMLFVTTEAFAMTIEAAAVRYWLSGIGFVGIGLIGPNLVILFADFTGRNLWLTRRRRRLLNTFGLGLGLVRFTDPFFGLMYSSEVIVHQHGLFLSQYEPGPLHYVLMAVLVGAMLLGFFNIAWVWRDAAQLMRRHLIALGVSCAIPVTAAALFNAGFQPCGWLDPTAFSLIATVSLTTWAVFHDQLVAAVPIARNTLVDQFRDGVLVADPKRIVVDTNPALRRMLGLAEGGALGSKIATVVANWPALVDICAQDETAKIELHPKIDNEIFWSASWQALPPAADGQPSGFLLTLRDISTRKKIENQLQELLAERTREWRRASNSVLHAAEVEKRKAGQALRATLGQELVRCVEQAETLASEPRGLTGPDLTALARRIADTNRRIQDFASLLEGPDLAHQTFREALAVALAHLQSSLNVTCQLVVAPDFPTPTRERARHLIEIVREAVINGAHLGNARNFTINLALRVEEIVLTVSNDGSPLPQQDKSGEGRGIPQLRLRTTLLNGRLSLHSGPTGGAVVEIVAPAQNPETQPGFFQTA